jgi:hypothetical protein
MNFSILQNAKIVHFYLSENTICNAYDCTLLLTYYVALICLLLFDQVHLDQKLHRCHFWLLTQAGTCARPAVSFCYLKLLCWGPYAAQACLIPFLDVVFNVKSVANIFVEWISVLTPEFLPTSFLVSVHVKVKKKWHVREFLVRTFVG